MTLTKKELENRKQRFFAEMNERCVGWDTAVIAGGVNQYYFTGTMQDGILVIKSSGELMYFVRRSFDRAKNESPMPECIFPMVSFREVAEVAGKDFGACYLDEETMPRASVQRMTKYISAELFSGLDAALKYVRAVKSPYELGIMERSGQAHRKLLEDIVPGLLVEGMSEAQLFGEVFRAMINLGHHGPSRFSAFGTETIAGQISFGEGTLFANSFNGPAGMLGGSSAVPNFGSSERKLKKGDMVFVDIAFGMDGYHTDKTQIYTFKGKAPKEFVEAHEYCLGVEKSAAAMLTPGAIPSEIYKTVLDGLTDEMRVNFMGMGRDAVKFLGHGVGLVVDEYPVIAKGFDRPLVENMTLALEPKRGIPAYGLAGVEDTFVVTKAGGKALTGGGKSIIEI